MQGAPAPARQPDRLREMDISSPTLVRVSIAQPDGRVTLGPDDRVLDSLYNQQFDRWEALVVLQPREESEDADEDDD